MALFDSRSPNTVTVCTVFCYNIDPALNMKPENTFAFAIASRSGQFHGVMALLSVMMYYLQDSSIHIPNKVILSNLIGDIPAMAEVMNRCGHASKQACPKCKIQGDTVKDVFDKPKNTSQTYAMKLSEVSELKTEEEFRHPTTCYIPLSQNINKERLGRKTNGDLAVLRPSEMILVMARHPC